MASRVMARGTGRRVATASGSTSSCKCYSYISIEAVMGGCAAIGRAGVMMMTGWKGAVCCCLL